MHCIEGLVAQYEHLKAAQERMAPAAHVALLAQGFGLLLMTEDETNNYADYFDNLPLPGESVADDFYICRVSETLLNFASELSRTCPVVYVGTCYWGGDGVQCAGLWENGQMLEQPIWTRRVGVVSAALKKSVSKKMMPLMSSMPFTSVGIEITGTGFLLRCTAKPSGKPKPQRRTRKSKNG